MKIEAEKVATMELKSQREEAEMDMKTIEEPPRSRRVSRASTAPPAPPRPPVPDLSEVHGPLYPVERKHQFPKDPPPREDPKFKNDLKFPVYVAEGSHSFQEIPKAGEKVSSLSGPVREVDHAHHYTKEDVTSIENKTLLGPTYTLLWILLMVHYSQDQQLELRVLTQKSRIFSIQL